MNRKQIAIATLITASVLAMHYPDIKANLINEVIVYLVKWAVLTLIR
ncbi:hypothetical protein [Nostoc cycadae]|nr:hypothetical protein [Nostoc cycadae]